LEKARLIQQKGAKISRSQKRKKEDSKIEKKWWGHETFHGGALGKVGKGQQLNGGWRSGGERREINNTP